MECSYIPSPPQARDFGSDLISPEVTAHFPRSTVQSHYGDRRLRWEVSWWWHFGSFDTSAITWSWKGPGPRGPENTTFRRGRCTPQCSLHLQRTETCLSCLSLSEQGWSELNHPATAPVTRQRPLTTVFFLLGKTFAERGQHLLYCFQNYFCTEHCFYRPPNRLCPKLELSKTKCY